MLWGFFGNLIFAIIARILCGNRLIIFSWVTCYCPLLPHPLPPSPPTPFLYTINSMASIPCHQIWILVQTSILILYLSINNSNYTCVDSHCGFKCNMKWMLNCCHLKDCYDNHTDNINIAFPPVCLIVFILCVFYKESAKQQQNFRWLESLWNFYFDLPLLIC